MDLQRPPLPLSPRACLGQIRQRVSGQRAFQVVEQVSHFHRIQASPGFRDAAARCAALLQERGIAAAIREYPADPAVSCFTQRLFFQWNCRQAQLELTSPRQELLCRFSDNDMCIIQRSAPADFRNAPMPIVCPPEGADPDRLDLDLRGKLLFVENKFDAWTQAAVRLGAAGILTVSMPETPPVRVAMAQDPELRDHCANLSFAPEGGRGCGDLFGFVLTPAQGARLRETCQEMARRGETPMARGFVDSEFSPGTIQVVDAWIPGTGDEEILMTAHLCHPKSSVNDNASGVGSAVEAITALQELIDAQVLPRPQRTIRLLLVPEMTGTYAYLSANEGRLDKIKAGLNIDMVAGRQDGRAGPLLVIDTPDCARSFVGDLARILLDELGKECALSARGQYVPLFNSGFRPFMPGSDHVILSDPTVGIPAVALTQWPDKTYHTSADSLAHIDPGLLARTAVLAAANLYSLAALKAGDLPEILGEVQKRFLARFTDLSTALAPGEDAWCCRGHALATCQSVCSFFPPDAVDVQQLADGAQRRLGDMFALLFPALQAPAASGPIPRRLFRAPLAMKSLLAGLERDELSRYHQLESAFPECRGLVDYAVYAMDGERTVSEVAACIHLETGVQAAGYVAGLCEFLRSLGLIDYVESETQER